MEMRVNPDYHELRVEELELTADFQMKVQEEKEEAREERARLREQRKVEPSSPPNASAWTRSARTTSTPSRPSRASGDDAAAADLETRLHEIDEAIEQNDYRAANIRAGYIYVISNLGALGPNIVKIGMTRRLEPRIGSGSSAMLRCRSSTTRTPCSSPRTPSRWRTNCTRRSPTGAQPRQPAPRVLLRHASRGA